MDDLLTDSASAMPEACDGSATRPLPTNLLTAELLTDTAFAISETCDGSATKPLPTNLLTAELLTDGPSPPTTEPLPPGDAPATHRATTGPLALTPLTVDRFTGEPRPAGLLP